MIDSRLMNSVVRVILIFSLLFMTSCGRVSTEEKPLLTKSYSGEEIFLGLIFGEGEVAKLFPEIWESAEILEMRAEVTPEQAEVLKQFQSDLLNYLTEQNPAFFSRFSESMQSGNHLRIASALDEASLLMFQALSPESGFLAKYGVAEISIDVQQLALWVGGAIAVVVVAVVHAYGAVYIGGAAAVTATAVFATNVFWPRNALGTATNTDEGLDLERSIWINKVAARL